MRLVGTLIFRASSAALISSVFFFQAEDGIRGADVTGVQTCALPISQTYAATSSDVGSTIRVTVTASNSAGSSSASSSATAAVAAAPPSNTGAPTVSGTAQDGQTLTATSGAWGGTTPISYGYQWRSCDTSGGNCADIGGATGQAYTLVSGDVGSTILVTVTASNSGGSSSANSAATSVVQAAAAPPSNTSPPTISGTPRDGQTLTANNGSWTGDAPIGYGYQWRHCDASGGNCADIGGATAQTYAVTSSDVGSTIRVTVTASNSAGSSSASSAATATVAAAPPSNTGAPTVSGTAQDGQTRSEERRVGKEGRR